MSLYCLIHGHSPVEMLQQPLGWRIWTCRRCGVQTHVDRNSARIPIVHHVLTDVNTADRLREFIESPVVAQVLSCSGKLQLEFSQGSGIGISITARAIDAAGNQVNVLDVTDYEAW